MNDILFYHKTLNTNVTRYAVKKLFIVIIQITKTIYNYWFCIKSGCSENLNFFLKIYYNMNSFIICGFNDKK